MYISVKRSFSSLDDSWPQFVVIQGKSLSFRQMSPISFAKFLVQTIGEPETCKRLHNGNYLVKCSNQEQSDKFLSISHIGDIEVDTFPHERLNAVKGVITSENLSDNSDEEVLEWLTRNGFPASSIYRFPRKESQGWTFRQRETLQRTFRQTAVITFQLHKLPMEIDIALEKCKVRPYIPNPQRCFRCQRYGHVNRTCKSRHEVCANCGSTDHVNSQENPCTASSKCVNCQRDHRHILEHAQNGKLRSARYKSDTDSHFSRKKGILLKDFLASLS